MNKRVYQVKDVARLAAVSVRTLHHYEAIGLLQPRQRSGPGYRLYNDDDLLRLQQILIGRALGWSLETIRHSLDDPNFDRHAALLAQREAITQRVHEQHAMLQAIDHALRLLDQPSTSTEEGTMKELFNGFQSSPYADEAKERWGESDVYRESTRRTQAYSAAQWQEYRDEQEAIYRDAAAAMQRNDAAQSEGTMEIAQRHRLAIDRWFYPCSLEMHCNLAAMYEGDSRFSATIDRYGTGLTAYLVAAIRANAERFT